MNHELKLKNEETKDDEVFDPQTPLAGRKS